MSFIRVGDLGVIFSPSGLRSIPLGEVIDPPIDPPVDPPPMQEFNGQSIQAANINDVSYYDNTRPFIDYMKGSGVESWQDADGWMQGLAPGASVDTALAMDLDPVYGYFPPGNYKIRSTSAATLSVTGSGFTSLVSGVGACTFTVTEQPSGVYGGLSIRPRITNNTGAPINITDWQVYRVEHEALLDAGQIFTPEFLADVRRCSVLRLMDWTKTNNSTLVRPSQLPKRTARTYADGVPYAICAELAAATRLPVWICLPAVSDVLGYRVNAATNVISTTNLFGDTRNHGWANAQPIAFYNTNVPLPSPLVHGTTYYARNVTASTFQVSATESGAIIDLGTVEDSYGRVTGVYDPMPLYRAIAQEMYAANPRAQVIVECSNEVWNWTFDHYHFFRDVVTKQAGETDDVAPTLGYRSLQAWKAFGESYPRNQITRMLAWHTQNYTNALFDYVDPGVIQAGQTVAALCDQYSHAPYLHCDIHSAADMLAAGAATQTDAWWTARFEASMVECAERAVSSKNAARLKKPGIPITSYECGQHLFLPVASWGSEHTALAARWEAFINGPAGVALYQDSYERIFVPGEMLHFNHYVHSARVYGRSQVGGWGMKRAHEVADTQRMAWFKALPTVHPGMHYPATKAKVYVSGHSLSSQPNLGNNGLVASSLDLDYAYARQNFGGATLAYRLGSSGEISTHLAAMAAAAGTAAPFTHLELTERHDLSLSIWFEDTVRNLKRYVDSAMIRDPRMIPYFWHCWQSKHWVGTIAQWITYERAATRAWEAVTARVNHSLAFEGKQYRIRNAPAQKCWVDLVDQAVNGSVPGITQGSTAATLALLYADDVHPTNPIGDYFLACVHMAIMYQRSPVGAGRPSGVTSQQAASLQALAWESVCDYYANEWFPTLPQARTYLAGTFGPACDALYGGSNAASFAALINANSYTSPFYFNAATDAGYWHAPL